VGDFVPPVDLRSSGKDAAEFAAKREDHPQGQDLNACWLPSPPRKLTRLANIPVMILTAEASYHAPYDHCTSQYLTRAGVANDHVKLGDRGIHGNGHMMMIEKNNLQVADVIEEWLRKRITPRH